MKTRKRREPWWEIFTLDSARDAIRDKRADFYECYTAGLFICINRKSTFEDLLACLKRRGASFRAARKLHKRTRRPLKDGKEIVNVRNWRRYLKERGKI